MENNLNCFKLLSSIQSLVSSVPKKVIPKIRELSKEVKLEPPKQKEIREPTPEINLSGATFVFNVNLNLDTQDLNKTVNLATAGAVALVSSASAWVLAKKNQKIRVPLISKIKVPLLSKIKVPRF